MDELVCRFSFTLMVSRLECPSVPCIIQRDVRSAALLDFMMLRFRDFHHDVFTADSARRSNSAANQSPADELLAEEPSRRSLNATFATVNLSLGDGSCSAPIGKCSM